MKKWTTDVSSAFLLVWARKPHVICPVIVYSVLGPKFEEGKLLRCSVRRGNSTHRTLLQTDTEVEKCPSEDCHPLIVL